jgi:hypothetical protein
MALEAALDDVAKPAPRRAQVVELCYFGLRVKEVAEPPPEVSLISLSSTPTRSCAHTRHSERANDKSVSLSA